jgi:hypothetical protein
MSTRVYRVLFDVERFQAFLWDGQLPARHVREFDGRSKLRGWEARRVYSDQPRLDRPDIWQLVGSAALVMGETVISQLEPCISSSGELLPLVDAKSGDTVLALNILRDIDCLDLDESSLDPIEPALAFLEHRLPESGLFKVPEFDTTDIFCLEREDDPESLRGRIARLGLRGVAFQLVWSNTEGPIRTNRLDFLTDR